MSGVAQQHFDKGGMCYAACQEAFEYWNSSTTWCRKGCDFTVGRGTDPIERESLQEISNRKKAENMCKMLATNQYSLGKNEDLDRIEDYRIHGTMYSTNATNLYKACLAGVRRQRY